MISNSKKIASSCRICDTFFTHADIIGNKNNATRKYRNKLIKMIISLFFQIVFPTKGGKMNNYSGVFPTKGGQMNNYSGLIRKKFLENCCNKSKVSMGV